MALEATLRWILLSVVTVFHLVILAVIGLMALAASGHKMLAGSDLEDILVMAYAGALLCWALGLLCILRSPALRGVSSIQQIKWLSLVAVPVYGILVVQRLTATQRGFAVVQRGKTRKST
jgi:hypothetical protein